jgi:hypothetical protein
MTNTGAAGGLDKNASSGDAGYDPVIEVEELEKILGLLRLDRGDRDCETWRRLGPGRDWDGRG